VPVYGGIVGGGEGGECWDWDDCFEMGPGGDEGGCFL